MKVFLVLILPHSSKFRNKLLIGLPFQIFVKSTSSYEVDTAAALTDSWQFITLNLILHLKCVCVFHARSIFNMILLLTIKLMH